MKKLLLSAIVAFVTLVAFAQEKTTVKDDKTVKKTSTVPQKVHNTFSKHKHYSGKKTKHVTTVEKTNTK